MAMSNIHYCLCSPVMSESFQGESSHGARTIDGADPLDTVTGLPLVVCSHCHDTRIIALTCVRTANAGKRFFKCPRNKEKVLAIADSDLLLSYQIHIVIRFLTMLLLLGRFLTIFGSFSLSIQDPSSCPSYFFQEQYEEHLRSRGLLGATPDANPPAIEVGGQQANLPPPVTANQSDVQDFMAQIAALRKVVEACPRRELLLTGLIVFFGVLIFLVSAIIILLAVLIYLVAYNQ